MNNKRSDTLNAQSASPQQTLPLALIPTTTVKVIQTTTDCNDGQNFKKWTKTFILELKMLLSLCSLPPVLLFIVPPSSSSFLSFFFYFIYCSVTHTHTYTRTSTPLHPNPHHAHHSSFVSFVSLTTISLPLTFPLSGSLSADIMIQWHLSFHFSVTLAGGAHTHTQKHTQKSVEGTVLGGLLWLYDKQCVRHPVSWGQRSQVVLRLPLCPLCGEGHTSLTGSCCPYCPRALKYGSEQLKRFKGITPHTNIHTCAHKHTHTDTHSVRALFIQIERLMDCLVPALLECLSCSGVR